jgi:hypothetical protein
MALKKFKPRSPEVYLNKIKGDASLARLGHLNGLVDDVEAKKANQETGHTSFPYQWYPDASVVSTGAKYVYTDGTTLYGYKIIGMINVPTNQPQSNYINEYLGTLVLTNPTMSGLFPGKLSGMVTYYDGTSDYHFGNLSSSAYLWDDYSDERVLVNGITVNMYQYENFDNEIWYAITLESQSLAPGTLLSGVINYEIEFSYPSDFNNTTFKIIQD